MAPGPLDPGFNATWRPGGRVAQQEDPRGVATLIEQAVGDVNRPVAAAVGK
jgi:hypothetical protein